METCRQALRRVFDPLDAVTSCLALRNLGNRTPPGDPFAKGEARLRDPTVLGS